MCIHPLLDIKNLQVDFITENGRITSVRDINLTVSRNEIVGIAGESGSGKSVTSLAVLQLLPRTAEYVSGQILFSPGGTEQYDLLRTSKEKLRSIRGKEIGMIFQEPMTSLNPVFTCGFQVSEAIRLHHNISENESRRRTIELFEKVKLPQPERMYRRYPHQVSGGQKQRVMIAMAMSGNPSLLICDEPTTALDVTVQKTVLELIKDLQVSTGMGVIFITHDLGVISEIADRVVVMNKGNIVEQASSKKIFTTPAHSYTKHLLDINRRIREEKTEKDAGIARDNVFLNVEHLSVWFPASKSFLGRTTDYTRAVDDVSFRVYKGETLGLVGESGCGKTTLGRTLLRLIKPTSGKIEYEGRDLTSLHERELKKFRKNMQIVFQDPYSSLNPSITIGSAIEEPLKVHFGDMTHRQRKLRVVDLLEKVNLEASHFNRYPHEFSGGQRQRIVIARALALEPAFIVCDESVSALDVSVQAQVLELLNNLKREFGYTCIFISHDLSVVRYISDRVMVMNKGRIEETGPTEQVYNFPASPYTQNLLEAVPKLKPRRQDES